MKRYLITPAANADINEIWQYIAQDNPRAADRVELQLHKTMQTLSQFPGMGHTRDDIDDPALRFHRVHSYLIVYRYQSKPIEVIRVISAHRDVPRVLRE